MVAVQAQVPTLRPFSDIPKLPGTSLLGANLDEFRADALAMIIRAQAEHGDLVRVRMGPVRYLLVSDPDAIHHMLTENPRNYAKKTKGYKKLKRLLGEGLLTADGDFWLKQRRTMQPAFHRERIQGFADTMVRAGEEMVDGWQGAIEKGERIDVHQEMMRVTLRIIGLTMLSMDFNEEAPEIGDAVTACLVRIDQLLTAFPGSEYLPTAKNRKFKEAISSLNDVIGSVIRKRRDMMAAGEEAPNDLLTMLLEARDPETGDGMEDQQLFDEVMTIFLAGHETTANALTWTFRLLADNPEHRARMVAELEAAGPGPFGMQDLDKIKFTKQCIQESMRLYPAIWLLGRQSVDDDELLGHQIPGGTNHFISPWLLHRHPGFWKDPETFDPDRFAENGPASKLPKGLYIPFLEGPRQCIGKAFAMMEAQLLLANIYRRVDLELEPDQKVRTDPVITLRPKDGLPMTVKPRAACL